MKKIYAGLFLLLAILVIVVVAIKTLEPQRLSYENYIDDTKLSKEVSQITDLPEVQVAVEEENYDYLFTSSATTNEYSNIIGTISYEAFAWYVPDWLVENWDVNETEGKGYTMTFSPKKPVNYKNISNITFYVEPSTETFNAQTMYEDAKKGGAKMSEIILSEHGEGMLQVNIESATRIYHVQTESINAITDQYYIDGNNKTLMVTFFASKEIFDRYTQKIRDMVKGIAEVKSPQG